MALWGAFLSWDVSQESHTIVAFNVHPFTRVDDNIILHPRKCKSGIIVFLGVRNSTRTESGPVLLGSVHKEQCPDTHLELLQLPSPQLQVLAISYAYAVSALQADRCGQKTVVSLLDRSASASLLSWVHSGLICT